MAGGFSSSIDAAAARARAGVNFAQQGKGPPTAGGHALGNGLKLHYEIHGSGEPLVVLHGRLMTIGLMEPLVTALAESRQVIAVELEELWRRGGRWKRGPQLGSGA